MKILYFNLLKSNPEFKNFNVIPFISLYWDDGLLTINMGIGRHCIQLSLLIALFFMKQPEKINAGTPEAVKPLKGIFQIIFERLLSLCFGFCWMIIVFKALHVYYFRDLTWWAVTWPIIFFVLASLSYIIITFAYLKYMKGVERPLSEEEIRLAKRRGHLHKKPTRIKDTLAKVVAFLIAVIIAYLILQVWH